MTSFSKKIFALALFSTLFGAGVAMAGNFTCRLTLARQGDGHHVTKGVIHLNGYVGERETGDDDGTGFRYKIEIIDGQRMQCRGNRRQANVSLYDGNDRKPLITAATCFESNRDFLINSSAENHWIYFQCYANNPR